MGSRIRQMVVALALCGQCAGAFDAPAAQSANAAAEAEATQNEAAIAEAAAALDQMNAYDLLGDRERAAAALRNIIIVEPVLNAKPDVMVSLLHAKQFALIGLERVGEAEALSKQLLRDHPRSPVAYDARYVVAIVAKKPHDALETIEAAARNVSDRETRAALSEVFHPERVFSLMQHFSASKDEGARHRAAEALLMIDWKAGGDFGIVDYYRKLSVDARMKRGDEEGARAMVRDIDTPAALLELMTIKKYDALFDANVDRARLFGQAVELEGARTARDLGANPDDPDVRLRRIQHMRSVGGHADVLELTDRYATDMEVVAQAGERAFWAVNERAYSLLDLGRNDEAVGLMQKLIALDVAKHPDLVSMSINHGIILNEAGRPAEAVAHAKKLVASAGNYASPYGHMWIWSSAACALAAQGKIAEASPWLEKIQAKRDDNIAALTRTLICLDRLEEAEATIIERLSAEDPSDMVAALQDFREDDAAQVSAFGTKLKERQRMLAARPAVTTALDKVGRVLKLPVVQSYWGGF